MILQALYRLIVRNVPKPTFPKNAKSDFRLNNDEMVKEAVLSVATINSSSVVCSCYKSKRFLNITTYDNTPKHIYSRPYYNINHVRFAACVSALPHSTTPKRRHS